MNTPWSRFASPLAAAALLAAVAGVSAGCASAPMAMARSAPAPATGKVMSGAQLRAVVPGAIIGESNYAEVNSAWLPAWHRVFRAKLFQIGIVKWDERFDCNRIAEFYASLAQAFFSVDMFHSDSPAQALALGPIWYERADGKGRHAIIQALTERGRVFIDPQTGLEMDLAPGERQSAYVQLF